MHFESSVSSKREHGAQLDHHVVDNTEHPEHLLLHLPFPQNFIEKAAVNENFTVLSYCRHFLENFTNFVAFVLYLDSSMYSLSPSSCFL